MDIKTRQKIYELIEELVQKKKIVLFATHEIEELKKIDKIVILQKGRKIGELNVREHKEIETILLKYV
ncbi:ATP-binding cassette domain-containing protein [Thermosipho melanesiensis]|uniref:ABC transporter related n=1 Tax=Thermosipho melanesiensis TaxID=46541 RepID=A0ABM6GGT9_9BACT|nr:ABC transporter ATP-binding protein [Thermosipho melanesiensis]APT74818.1 hypothetical protein BW47_02240 [Thermosipho melanesiensis]